ncbi:MAG: hypothetical protein ACHQAY_19375 [Hyphomicrobiales bacterium]
MLGDLADAASLAALRRKLGLDQNVLLQFGLWFAHALEGDLGSSIASNQPVADIRVNRHGPDHRVARGLAEHETVIRPPAAPDSAPL